MIRAEDLKTWSVTKEVRNARGSGWVICLPYPGPLAWRLRDAWEVVRGRAVAVRESIADEMEAAAQEQG